MRIRLLVCHDCRTIEEIPDYKGDPQYDVLLENRVAAHRFPNGEEHIGALADVDEDDWNNPPRQQEIRARIGPSSTTGLPSEHYAAKETYQEEALKCFDAHQRPKEGCIDFKDHKKRLGNPTKEGWDRGPKMFLCQFCPVQSWVNTQIRDKQGMYK